MKYYEKIQQDKVFCASLLSAAYHTADYEDDDYDPMMMKLLDTEYARDGRGLPQDGEGERCRVEF